MSAYRIYNPETGKRSSHLRDTECIRLVAIEVPERALELLQLRRRQVRHVPRHNLVVDERHFLRDALDDEFQLEAQALRCEDGVVVLVYVRFDAFLLCRHYLVE